MSRDFDKNVLESIRMFGMEHFGSMKNLAEAMGVKPQNLSAYLKGERKIGPKYWLRLKEIGFIIPENTDNTDCVSSVIEESSSSIDIDGAIELSNTPAPRLAQLMGVSPATLDTWRTGASTPTLEQLVNLFNLTVALGLSARHAPPKPLDTAETTDEPTAPMPPAQATA